MGVRIFSRRLFGLSLVVALLLGVSPAAVSAQTVDTCVEGFDTVEAPAKVMPLDVLTNSATSAFLAGSARTSLGVWSARIVRFDRGGWRTITTKVPKAGSSALVAIAGSAGKGRWAVGYVRTNTEVKPKAIRQRNDGRWKSAWVPRSGARNAVLADVAVRKTSAWAAGYRYGAPGSQMPHVVRWNGKRWKVVSPSLSRGERGMLTTVSSTWAGGTWIGGSVTKGRVERPYVARRVGGGWRRQSLPVSGQGSITSVMVTGKRSGWAVGYRMGSGTIRPLVLRWNGQGWKRLTPPTTREETLLLDVDIDDGDVVLTGSTWSPAAQRMRPVVARRQGSGWQLRELKGFDAGGQMSSIDGLRSQRGFLAARSLAVGALVRTCDGDGVSAATRKSERKDRRLELSAVDAHGYHEPEVIPEPRVGLAGADQLEVQPRARSPVDVVERAAAAGLRTWGPTYGAVIRDFDGDLRKDVFLGGHGRNAVLYLNGDGVFSEAPIEFDLADRHGCTASDFDGSGLPDLYCSFGGGGGYGIKANELVLDPGGKDPRLTVDAGGVRELLSRGRIMDVLDYDDDGHKDLVIGASPNRADGLPSYSRIYRWIAPARFELVRDSGIAPSLGVRSVDTADFDRDGRKDLLTVTDDSTASGSTTSLRLYRNTNNGLKAVQARRGIKSIGEVDAELAGLDRDARFDLIQLSRNRIRVSLQRKGKFVKVYERRLSRAKALAVGDADGDGDNDIFILRTKPDDGVNDLILFNDGNGRSFSAIELPSAAGGWADAVYAIDHDGNGMTDFLTLNGLSTGTGPIELFAFYPR